MSTTQMRCLKDGCPTRGESPTDHARVTNRATGEVLWYCTSCMGAHGSAIPLESPANCGQSETTAAYGARLLTFLLRTGITATLTDDQLELAEYACGRALSTRVSVGPPDSRESTPAAVYDAIEEVRRTVVAMLKGRAADRGPVASVAIVQPQAVPPKDGPGVLRPEVPMVRPPSYDRVKVDIAF